VLLTLGIRDVLPATPRARIVRLDLGNLAFEYLAGQAVRVGAPGERRRPYSLAASPEDARRDRCLELLVGAAPDAPESAPPFEPGRRVEVEGPLGSFTFPPAPAERRFVFIAGGTGIAPLRSMLRHALAIPHQEIGLFYSARTPDDFAYGQEFLALAADGRLQLRLTVTRSMDEKWPGSRGRFGRAALEPLVHDPATLCFVCGPPAFVTQISTALDELGIGRARIRKEEWGS
jgi:ferredoxin-NADP reductase